MTGTQGSRGVSPSRSRTGCDNRTRGFTLIELVAVLAVFAMVALMGLQALTGTMRTRDRLAEVADDSAALSRALVLLRADLAGAVPMAFLPPRGDRAPAFLHRPETQALELSVGGQAALPGEQSAGTGRVIWRLDRNGGRLTRQAWRALNPGGDAARGPEVVMLEGVTGFELRALAEEETGWITGFGRDPRRSPISLPRAVDLRLTTAAQGPLRVMVAY